MPVITTLLGSIYITFLFGKQAGRLCKKLFRPADNVFYDGRGAFPLPDEAGHFACQETAAGKVSVEDRLLKGSCAEGPYFIGP